MIVSHVSFACGSDYVARRREHREALLHQLLGWRAQGVFIGGGPAPDGRTADAFFRTGQPSELEALIAENEFWRAGLWTGYTPRSFKEFVEPWQLPPVDESRHATIVEGPTADHEMAQFALIEMRGAGQLAFGGFFEGGETLALVRTAEPEEARAWLAETGFWASDRLTTRPLIHVL